jgi:hypothetical protein
MVPINQLVAAVENRYSTTPATAIECLKQLNYGLMVLGKGSACAVLRQGLYQMADDENGWDNLSAAEQAGKDVPKGKTRKSTGQA